MAESDLTVAILREIRDEIRTTRTELKAEIAETNRSLSGRIDETNNRLAVVETTLKDFAGQHLLLTRYVKHVAERHGDAIDDLHERVGILEAAPKSGRS